MRPLSNLVLVMGLFAARAASADELPHPLRAVDIVRLALAGRAEIAAARARSVAASERPAIVSALEDPVVAVSVDHLPFSFAGADGSVTVEQAFPLSRIRANRGRAAEANARRARSDVDVAKLDVAVGALGSFYLLHALRRRAEVFDEQLVLARQIQGVGVARFQAGQGGQAEVLRAQNVVIQLEAEREALGSRVVGAEAMLATSLGLPVGTTIPALELPVFGPEPPPLEEAARAAAGTRPELAGLQADVARADAETDVMGSMYSPMMFVRGGPSYTMSDGPGVMLMVGLTIPLWRGKLSAGVREAQGMATMSREELRATRRVVEGEVAATRADVLAARTLLRALTERVIPTARQTVDAILASYAAGQASLVAVLDAATALWDARREQAMAEAEVGLAWTRFERAAGTLGVAAR